MTAALQPMIGRHTYGEKLLVDCSGGGAGSHLEIGAFCSLAGRIRVILGGEHRTDWATTFPFHGDWGAAVEPAWGRGNVTIGNDVWIGTEALILSGSKIGDGAVVGARTVVSGEVAPYAVVAGNPMRFVRWRFSTGVRAELLLLQWWNWPDERIKKAVPFMLDADVEKFIYMANRGEL